ncbi:MAG: hypothetical protein ACOVO2_17465 [Emticicia sp.]|uniref:hypothetical protein n=1 Tax=Emticicia sp. TaxID=1930953 RepID=UPI003BA714B6
MKTKISIILFFIIVHSTAFSQSVLIQPSNLEGERISLKSSTITPTLRFETPTGGTEQLIRFYVGSQENARISSLGSLLYIRGRNEIKFTNINDNTVEERMSINLNGIRISDFDFSENTTTERRPVFADKDGILRIENSSNHYASYNFSAVQAQDYDDQLRKGSGFAWFNTTNIGATMYLPINLPDGVKVTNIRMFLLDNSASNLSFTFNKNSHLSNTFTAIATAQSSTNTANIFSLNDNANEIIDNQNNSYYINISSVGNWTGNTLQFHSLVITYQYQ